MAINLPTSDDVLERHQFYAAAHADIANIHEKVSSHHESIHRVHSRMDVIALAGETQKLEQIKTETRNRTLAAAVVVAWTVISGAFSWAWDKSSSKVEIYVAKFEKVEKDFAELRAENIRLKEETSKLKEDALQVNSIKRTMTTLQQQVERLEESRQVKR